LKIVTLNYPAIARGDLTARRAAGWKVVILTILPRTQTGCPANMETYRTSVNTSIRNNWATFANALADVGADATIGVAGASNNATYYDADKVHPIAAGHLIIKGLVNMAVSYLFPIVPVGSQRSALLVTDGRTKAVVS
jgi:hypothetical protein